MSDGLGGPGRQAARCSIPFGAPGVVDQARVQAKRYLSDRCLVEKLGACPRKVASLYVGRREGDKLLYAGKVRTGYTEASARELRERLDPLIRRTSPLSIAIKKPKATWVEPQINAEVEYGALTDDGLLHARRCSRAFATISRPPKVRAPWLAPSPVHDLGSACRGKTCSSFFRMRMDQHRGSDCSISAMG